jgi:hypothetical protein
MVVAVCLLSESGIEGSKTFSDNEQARPLHYVDAVGMRYGLNNGLGNIADAKEFEEMEPLELLVNTSRGPIVDQDALLGTLEKRQDSQGCVGHFRRRAAAANQPVETSQPSGARRAVRSPYNAHMEYVDDGIINTSYAETARECRAPSPRARRPPRLACKT